MKSAGHSHVYILLFFIVPIIKALPLCSVGQFSCRNSPKCIPTSWLCDGARDCPDGSDETHSNCHSHRSNTTCSGDQPECRHGGFQRCIPQNWLCDGHMDCDQGEDEMNCHGEDDVVCDDSEYSCGNLCLGAERLCNGVEDCQDGSDEEAVRCIKMNRIRGKPQAFMEELQETRKFSSGNVTKPAIVTTKLPTTATTAKLTSTTTAITTTAATSTSTTTSTTTATPKSTTTAGTTTRPTTSESESGASTRLTTSFTWLLSRLEATVAPRNITQTIEARHPSPTTVTIPSPLTTTTKQATTAQQTLSTTVAHQASTSSYLKFLNYRLLEPVNSRTALKEISGEVFWNFPKPAEKPATPVMAKTFHLLTITTATTTTTESGTVLSSIFKFLRKREANTTMEEQKSESPSKEEDHQQQIVPLQPPVQPPQPLILNRTEVQPVKSIKGVPIKPMNL